MSSWSAICTAARFDAAPLTRMASAINLSSMSMFVRILIASAAARAPRHPRLSPGRRDPEPDGRLEQNRPAPCGDPKKDDVYKYHNFVYRLKSDMPLTSLQNPRLP
jgi:hypothetical protein